MQYDIITIGGITEDIMFHTDDLQIIKNPKKSGSKTLFSFESGDKIVSDERVLRTAGGGGANSAVSLSKLGLKTALLGAVGVDPAALKLLHQFKKQGVNTSLVQAISKCWTGLSFVITAGTKNDHVIFTNRAANERLNLKPADCLKLKSQWFYLTSLSGTFWKHNLEMIFNTVGKKRVKVAWNPGSTQLRSGYSFLKNYLKQTSVLILNKEEARELAASSGIKIASVKETLKKLSLLGPEVISVSDGARGAYIYSNGQYKFEKALSFPAVNTTGAGDAFGSSLVGGLILYHNDLEKALKLAIIRSNYVVRKIGAQEGLLMIGEAEEKM